MATQLSDYKVQVSLTLPPAKQYQGSPMMNVRADNVGELEVLLQALRESASPVVRAFFDALPLAPEAVAEAFGATEVPAVPVPAPAADAPACPECGQGAIVQKSRRDSKGHFFGCNRFPECRYIDKERSPKR